MITYNLTTRQYERDDGSVITAAELRAMFDMLDAETKKQLRAVSRKRENGDIATDQWAEAILAILIAAHIVSISLGKGGVERVTQADWDTVQEKIAWREAFPTSAQIDAAYKLAQKAGVLEVIMATMKQ